MAQTIMRRIAAWTSKLRSKSPWIAKLTASRHGPYTSTCTQNNYKFEGKERDTETGNDDFGARYDSNRFGRWLSADWSGTPTPVPYANLANPNPQPLLHGL